MRPPDPGSVKPAVPSYTQADWDRYQDMDRLVNHWERPGWHNGQRSYHWIITFGDSPYLPQLAARCQKILSRHPTLDLVPTASLHLTVQRVAFTNEITPAMALAIADAGARLLASVPSFTATVGPLAGSPGAVRFSAGPHEPFHDVRAAAQTAIAQARGPEAVPNGTTPFVPHVSIAYNNRATPARPVIDTVAHLRTYGAVTVPICAIDLVELRRQDRTYVWERIAIAPLATNQSPPDVRSPGRPPNHPGPSMP